MNTTMLKRARRHFVHDMAPRQTQRRNMREWVRAWRVLGDKSLLAKQVERK